MRKNGVVPVVCYASGKESVPAGISLVDLKKVIQSGTGVIEGNGPLKGNHIMLKDVDYAPITREPMHADFLMVDTTTEIKHEVHVELTGIAPAEKTHNAFILQSANVLEVSGLAHVLPKVINVDITVLENIGDSILAGAVDLPKGVKLISSEDEAIVSAIAHKEEKEEPEEERDVSSIEVSTEKKEEEGDGEKDEKAEDKKE